MSVKIAIAGIGGVGGYYGGLLAKQYLYEPEVDVFFIARGNHLKKIKEIGLIVKTDNGTFVGQPRIATDKPSEIGVVDYIIVTTKSYDLENAIEELKPCIGKNTVVLPLLNGIDITPRIKKLLPNNEIWYGCTYIVARKDVPGVVKIKGNVTKVVFGASKQNERLTFFEKILKDAKFNVTLSNDILLDIWTKFAFISTTASLTSYFDSSFGALLLKEQRNYLEQMLKELIVVANAEGVKLDDSVISKVTLQLEKLPFETTSSMHTDFQEGRETELETLVGVVIQLADKNGIEVPTYKKVYNSLKTKSEKLI